MGGTLAIATFGLGCFWCGEASFSGIDGVISTCVGYMGGDREQPTYELVRSGETDHLEVVQVEYDPAQVTYQQLLEHFWRSHNPAPAKEGDGDSGGQYQSAIFFHTEEQKVLAEVSKRRIQASGKFRGRITTKVVPASRFWVAEDHHQCYIAKMQKKGPT
jgi:peptide-methionine (S)-S-oxide reductase